MDYNIVPLFENYNEGSLKDLFLWRRTSEQLVEIKTVRYDSDTRTNNFQARLIEKCQIAPYLLEEREKFEKLFQTKLWLSANFYQGDELRAFYHGPQKINYFIDRSDYQTNGRAFPAAVVIIAGFIVVVPLPKP